jgi:hypothetical protein
MTIRCPFDERPVLHGINVVFPKATKEKTIDIYRVLVSWVLLYSN